MSKSLLEQLKSYTSVVADTGDFNSILKFCPRDATTNPSLLAAAAQMSEYKELVDEALRWAKAETTGRAVKEIVNIAADRLAIEFGLKIIKIILGRVSTEIDARLSTDTESIVQKARYLISLYRQVGVSPERVLIKIASTWEGIRAAEILEKEGIRCNMTLLFGLHQAVAAAEAQVTLVSPFVGRILDWHKKHRVGESYRGAEDPGVQSVANIYYYYKKYSYKTEVMGASFRNLEEIIELAGCDLLTISPKLLAELDSQTGSLERKLDPALAMAKGCERIHIDEKSFRRMHEEDPMAKDKLAEGIEGFVKSAVELEATLEQRLATL